MDLNSKIIALSVKEILVNYSMLVKKAFFLGAIILTIVSCVTTKKIKDGRTAFQQKQYAVAVDFIQDEIIGKEDSEEYAELSYLLGESYKNLNESDLSLKWYLEAAKNDYGPEAYWEMAYALKKNERYEDAILTFRRLGKMTNREREVRVEIEKCRQAQKWNQLGSEKKYILEAIELNSPESDYAPAIWKGSKIVFTSDRMEGNEDVFAWTGNGFSDLYVSEIDVFNPVPFDSKISTEHNEATATFSSDGNTMYFTRCYSETGDAFCQIYQSTLDINGNWNKERLAFAMKPKVHYKEPVLIENDSVMIFVSNDPTGIGGSDLYYTVLLEDNTWDVPELMPPYLNSTGFERFPTWDSNSKTLYYSSDHFTTLGGLDIFKTSLNDDGSWSKPENMLAPFNSSEDDYSLVFVEEAYLPPNIKMKAFFTSTRGVYGSDDIYSIVEEYPEDYIPPQDTMTKVAEVVEPEEEKSFFLSVQVYENLFAITDNPNSFVVGKKNIAGASLSLTKGNNKSQLIQTDKNGMIVIPIDSASHFEILAGKNGYLNKKESLTITDEEKSDKPDRFVFEMEIIIDRIFEDVEIVSTLR